MCSSYSTKSKMKRSDFEFVYQRKWDVADQDVSDNYVDESGANAIGFPGNKMPVITIEKPGMIQDYEFGFIPHWVKPEGLLQFKANHNAKIETIHELATWRDAWKNNQRCLVCTNGFYEYDKKRKQKVFIRLKDIENFYYAGIFNDWVNKQTGEVRKTMAIITTIPNELVATVHHRMPVIIKPGDENLWMDISNENILAQYTPPIDSSLLKMEDADAKLVKGG
ncbi:MAG: SOS response-associated peptidase [Chitinophagales bacterium]